MGLGLVAIAAASALELGEDVRFADEVTLEHGTHRWVVEDDSFLFPVRDGEEAAVVGWVAVGRGTFTFGFEDRWEAERFANIEVVAGGADPGTVAPAVNDGTWTEPVDAVLALTADPGIAEAVERSGRLVQDRKAVGYVDEAGIFNVVVTPLSLDRARAIAERALSQRVPELAAAGLDIEQALAVDRLDSGPDRLVVDVRTERSWLPWIEPGATNLQEQWLTTVSDPYGRVDDARSSEVFVIGRELEPPGRNGDHAVARGMDRGLVRRVRVAGTPGLPEAGAYVTEAQANVVVAREGTGMALRAEIEQRLVVTADRPTRLLALAQPHEPGGDFYGRHGMASLYGGLTVTTADGRPLERVADVFGVPPSQGMDVGMYLLPAELGPGEELTLLATHVDRWRLAHPYEVSVDQFNTIVDLGRVSAARRAVASVPGRPHHPVELRVGSTLPENWSVVVSGGKTELIDAGDARWWTADTDSRGAVTVARDRGLTAWAAKGMPQIHVLGQDSENREIPPYLRSILNFYGAVLPELSLPELDLVRAADEPVGRSDEHPDGGLWLPRVVATPGQVVVHGQYEIGGGGPSSVEYWQRQHAPRAVERGVAGAVAAQWLLDRPLAERDAWIASAIPLYLRERFTEEAWDAEVMDEWHVLEDLRLRNQLARATVAPLDTDERWSELARIRWLRALHARVGERAVMRGLEGFLLGEERTTDALSAALSEGAGRDLSHWVDFWVRGGVRPDVRAEWWVESGMLQLELTSDVPFGRLEVPVSVEHNRGSQLVWVDVRDGHGVLELPLRRPVQRVRIDPDELLLLRGASATRRDSMSSTPARDDSPPDRFVDDLQRPSAPASRR